MSRNFLPHTAFTYLVTVLVTSSLLAQSKYGQYAPDDAYIDDTGLAYYGSENPWNLRMFSPREAIRRYGRRSQRQLLAILDGRPGDAKDECEDWIANDRGDLESRFMLGVAECQLGEFAAAFETLRLAVEDGLPPERLVAGPRELLAGVYELDAYREYRATHPIELVHGPLLGAVTHDSARFWVRTARPADVGIRVFEPGGAIEGTTATAASRPESDLTAVIEVAGLRPATRYEYEVTIDERLQPLPFLEAGKRPSFETAPLAGTRDTFSFAFGGGATYTAEHERMWDTIAAQVPDALFLLGDNVYIDLPQQPGVFHRYTYYRRQSRPEFRRLVSSTPVYAIWDDHDAATDDVWLGPFVDRPSWKPAMLWLFRQNWNNPGYGTRAWPGCWFQTTCGACDFFFLDCRNYRTNPFGKQPTMLGPIQKEWLKKTLQASTATFKVIASSVPWAPAAKPGSRDTWDGFAAEREDIFSWLSEQSIDGVLLISADRHRSDAWRIERPNAYPLYDFSSSRLTNRHTHEAVPGSLFSYNARCSFGLVTLDMRATDSTATYRVINIDGEEIHRLVVRRSELE